MNKQNQRKSEEAADRSVTRRFADSLSRLKTRIADAFRAHEERAALLRVYSVTRRDDR